MSTREGMKRDPVDEIEKARQVLDRSTDEGEEYELIYENSVKLDSLIERYIVTDF